MSILSILNDISNTSKRTIKEEILLSHRENELLKKVCSAAYDPDIVYWISKHPDIEANHNLLDLMVAIDDVTIKLGDRLLTGNDAIEFYTKTLSLLSADDAEVLRRIIDRDLRCGIGIPTINKIWPNLIPTYDVMLAETDPKNLSFPDVVTQIKSDGIRCLATRVSIYEVTLRTRNGNRIPSLETSLSVELTKCIQIGETWDGELVCYDNITPLPRKKSNGIINKALRGTISDKEKEMVRFIVWDIVDYTQTISYIRRLDVLYSRLKSTVFHRVFPTETKLASSIDDVFIHFREALESGEEGIIAKNLNAVWQPKRTFDLVKFKSELTCDLVVVGIERGTGKNKDRLGALICESDDGIIQVNVGTGFTDSDREVYHNPSIVGRIVEVVYNARISGKSKRDSLYLPRFIRLREDKVQADSSQKIK